MSGYAEMKYLNSLVRYSLGISIKDASKLLLVRQSNITDRRLKECLKNVK